MLRYILYLSILMKAFNHKWMLNFVQSFSASIEIVMQFLSSILLMWYPQHMDPRSSTLLSYNSNSIGDTSPLFFFILLHFQNSLSVLSVGLVQRKCLHPQNHIQHQLFHLLQISVSSLNY